MNKHLMLDLETFSNTHDAAIVSIGACMFDPHGDDVGATFYQVIDLEISEHPGHFNGGTILWWLKQSEAARSSLTDVRNSEPLGTALLAFSDWVKKQKAEFLWSNGPNFDEVILKSAYGRYGMAFPFSHRGSRCVRTIRGLKGAPKLFMEEGVEHNARADAVHQARHIQLIYKMLGL